MPSTMIEVCNPATCELLGTVPDFDAAEVFNRRKLLVATQAAAMLLALGLAWVTLTATIHIAHIFVFATLLGCVNAIDIPTRQ